MSDHTLRRCWGKCPTCGQEQWWSAFQPFLSTVDETWEGITLDNFQMSTGQICHDTVSERRWLAVNSNKKEQNNVQTITQPSVYGIKLSHRRGIHSYW